MKVYMKLVKWQIINKDLDKLIVQNSHKNGRDSWQNIYIGMGAGSISNWMRNLKNNI